MTRGNGVPASVKSYSALARRREARRVIRTEADVTPKVLVWARTSLGLKPKEAARRLNVTEARLSEWELGAARPSIPQAERLAGLYKRPLAVFYMPAPPSEPTPPSDYRTLPGHHDESLSPASRLAIRKAQRLQRVARELAHDLGTARPVRLPRVNMDGDAETAAERVRLELGVPIETQFGWRDARHALNEWSRVLERLGVLVFQLDFPVKEMRGFSLPSPTTPAVVLCIHDRTGPRSFSMFHELAHLAGRDGVLCDMGWKYQAPAPVIRTEKFCNHFAGAFLVPRAALLDKLGGAGAGKAHDSDWPDERLRELAGFFKVSREVILRRLLIMGLTTQTYYEHMRRQWAEERPRSTPRKGFKRSPARTSISERGRPLIAMLAESYSLGNISFAALTDYLGVRGKHVEKVVALATTGA
jgi:Zn-dependent peptidase ImmA (M78 family)/DNA-binding transcriptional regulator YiaG